MTTRILTSILLILPFLEAAAQSDDYARSWGIHANFGGITQSESENADSRENEGNTFAVTADWFVTPRLALTGGIYAEQTGMLTHLDADGIGPKSFWMAGIQAGAKYYFFPKKWIVQPYAGAAVYANVLNLGHNRGAFDFRSNDYSLSRMHADYDIKCPALSLAPQIGIDLRLISSLSLTLAADYRWGIYGQSRLDVRHLDGQQGAPIEHFENPMSRTTLSLGLRFDFPARPVDWQRAGCTLLDLIYIWINGRN